MRFWDSSAIVPLLVPETASPRLQRLYDADPIMFAWWAAEVECLSAIVRRRRTGKLPPVFAETAFSRLHALRNSWHEIEPSDDVRESAKRFLRVHDLRTADAFQLAAAFFAAESRTPTLEFVCLDDHLLEAARREGFSTAVTAP